MDDCHEKKDQEGRIKNGCEPEPLSGGGEDETLEDSCKGNGKGKGEREDQLEEDIDFYSSFCSFRGFSNEERAHRLQDEPVGEDDSQGEFVAGKSDEKFSQEDDLTNDPADPHDEERDLEGYHSHISIPYQYILVL